MQRLFKVHAHQRLMRTPPLAAQGQDLDSPAAHKSAPPAHCRPASPTDLARALKLQHSLHAIEQLRTDAMTLHIGHDEKIGNIGSPH